MFASELKFLILIVRGAESKALYIQGTKLCVYSMEKRDTLVM